MLSAFRPARGSFEANPPFAPALVGAALDHIEELLERAAAANSPLSFAFVAPAWEGTAAWARLDACRFKRAAVRVDRDRHAWRDARGGGLARRVPVDTGLVFLQNDAGAAAWPCTESALAEVRDGLLVDDPPP